MKSGFSDLSNSSYSKYKRCDYLGCTEEAPFHCSTCSSFYCDHHPFHHDCIPDQHLAEANRSSRNLIQSSLPSIKTNYKDYGRCDYLGCTKNAPFYCKICKSHYCVHHPFRHDCIPDQHLEAVNKCSPFQSIKPKKISRDINHKCTELCCTTDAPFYCKICSSFYCINHALDHECLLPKV